MSTAYMNARCRKILDLLLRNDDYMPLQQLAAETGVSKRSIYYDICKINEWLVETGIPEIEAVRGKGALLDDETKRRIEAAVENEDNEEGYIFSPTERVRIIICYIVHQGEPVYIEQLTDYCQVSRNTIFSDLKAVTTQLTEYGLTLDYSPRTGYRITGDLIRIRALFFMYFSSLLQLFHSGVLTFINREQIEGYLDTLAKLQSELNVKYVDGILLSLAALLPLMYQDGEKPVFPDLREEEIVRTKEFSLIRKYFPDLDRQEQLYLCLHLLGSRVATQTEEMFDKGSDRTAYEITKSLIAEFEKVACVIFDRRDELERALFLHIKTSLYRYQYGIQIGNPISEDVIREYPNLFEITKLASRYLEQVVGLPIPDSEVAYLALHFGAFLKGEKSQDEKLRILIVCVNGISTGNMLRREITRLLPDSKITGVVALPDVVNMQDQCDLVISTVKLNSLVPSVVVHPVLTDYDRRLILNHRLIRGRQNTSDEEGIMEALRPYISEKDMDGARRSLERYLEGKKPEDELPANRESLGLIDFLEKGRVNVTSENYKWQDAVRFAARKLLDEGSIEQRYVDTIISEVRYYGPFMFVMQGLVLAHAKPEDGVNGLDVSLTVFKEPVRFSEFYEAKVIITLATVDQERHLKILSDIMDAFAIESRVDELAALNSPEEILEAVSEYLE